MNERMKLRFAFKNSPGENEVESLWVIRRDPGLHIRPRSTQTTHEIFTAGR